MNVPHQRTVIVIICFHMIANSIQIDSVRFTFGLLLEQARANKQANTRTNRRAGLE